MKSIETLEKIGQRVDLAIQLIAVVLSKAEICTDDLKTFGDFAEQVDTLAPEIDPVEYQNALAYDYSGRIKARLKLLEDALAVVETERRFGAIVDRKVDSHE